MIFVPHSLYGIINLKKNVIQTKIKIENFFQICALVRMAQFEK